MQENQNQNQNHLYICPNGHQAVRDQHPIDKDGIEPYLQCLVCGAPVANQGPIPPDRYGRQVVIDDDSGAKLYDPTPLVAVRNLVAESGFSYLAPSARGRLTPDHVVEIRYLTDLGPQKHLVAVVEHRLLNHRAETSVLEVEEKTDGTWTVGKLEYQWMSRTTTRPLPFGATGQDAALFNDLEAFTRDERCGDTWLYTPAIWSRKRPLEPTNGAVLLVVSESQSGLIQRYHFGYAYDQELTTRLDALLARHGVRYELLDHCTLALYR